MSGYANRRRWWWNAHWGRIARCDVLVYEDRENGRWRVEAREGGVEGTSRWFDVAGEAAALDLARDLMSDSDGWRELTS